MSARAYPVELRPVRGVIAVSGTLWARRAAVVPSNRRDEPCAGGCVVAADDAGGVGPGFGLVWGQGVGNDDLLDGVVQSGDLALIRGGLLVALHRRPEAPEPVEGVAAQQ